MHVVRSHGYNALADRRSFDQLRPSGAETIKGQGVSRQKWHIGTHVFQEKGRTDTHQNR